MHERIAMHAFERRSGVERIVLGDAEQGGGLNEQKRA